MIRRIGLLTLIFAANLFSLNAQNKIKKDSVLFSKVLLIPYDPHYYLSDADNDIAAATKVNSTAFRELFRTESDKNIYQAFVQQRKCVSLFQDTSAELYNDVVKLLSNIGFEYDTPTIKDKKSLKDKLHFENDNKQEQDSRISSSYLNDEQNKKYMKATMPHPELLAPLYNKYGFDLFVFVTQMEIKTNYASCMDIANKIYKREVLLHFTVYDKNGTLVAGNFAKTFFPSNSNNAYKIIGDCFPQLAQGILDGVK